MNFKRAELTRKAYSAPKVHFNMPRFVVVCASCGERIEVLRPREAAAHACRKRA